MHTRTTIESRTREIIKIGGQIWVNEGKGWNEAPAAIAARINQMTTGLRTLAPNLVGDAQCAGKKSVEGKEYVVYTYKMDIPGGKASSTNTLYVDPASNLPARILVEGRAGAMQSRTEMSYIYDASIKLEPPKIELPDQDTPKP
jgi:hypothetical protein